ncbi:Phosducin-like protein [Ceratocystis lukuohia]|uniref:Phosducin-like protein n=3 Tax=Ceratocystis TaxID=5157 RepID=A0A0F8CQ34_CERFI|nr:Phosducin-like protein [Ceratocystis platani]PHH51645.1 hypothetical protein CFIMG_002206RA [Ceratocystis fimbriata CBS 114723]
MSDPTPAQEEFNRLVSNSSKNLDHRHPEDRSASPSHSNDLSEEEAFRASQVEDNMRYTHHASASTGAMRLPPASFDANAATGVKGVIADARAYQAAKQSKFKTAMRSARHSIFGGDATLGTTSTCTSGHVRSSSRSASNKGSRSSSRSSAAADLSGSEWADEDAFLAQWRESRRRELEADGKAVRTRRTSPSVRVYGRFDEVDALGYLDAIEKVARDTTVVVFVYDPGCEVSTEVERALIPLVAAHSTTRFVKVHYEEVEFDAAAVPAILAYRNQGDLVANLTGMIEMMPDSESFTSMALQQLFMQHGVLR